MKKIYRGMQNAAEDIQANFDELSAKSITKISPAGSLSLGSTWTLTEPVTKFSDIFVVWDFLGNRGMTMVPSSDTIETRYSGINLSDSSTSAGWQLSETIAAITSAKNIKITTSKTVDQAGKIVNDYDGVSIVEIYGVNRK